jgi:NAD-dependent dihydropyrimidine dehydrogenase PreA subunit
MKHRYLSGVVTLEYDSSKCIGCGRCLQVCPHAVFAMENKKAVIIDKDACIECGACMKNCQPQALKVNAGVGCAAAILSSKKKNSPECGCGKKTKC